MYTAPKVSFAGYLDQQRHVILDESDELLWIGGPQETLDAIPIQHMPEPRNPRRSIRLPRRRKYATHQGELIHVSSPDDGERYFWQVKDRPTRQLAVCRPQDFTFNREEGDKLTVTPRQRTLYCAGRIRNRIIAVATTNDNEPDSAEVFAGRSFRDLQRKMVFQKDTIGDRLEMRYGSVLECDRDGMILDSEPLRMLDSALFRLKINHRKGTARLVRLPQR